MGRATPILIALLVVASIGLVPQSVAASDDEWPDDCDDAPIIDSGQYSGSIDTPDDFDYFRLQMDKGEYYSFRMIVPVEMSDFEFARPSIDISLTDVSGATNGGNKIDDFQPETEATWKAFAEEEGIYCFGTLERESNGADIPYEWQMSIEKNDPEPAGFETTELRNNIEQKNQRISELESRLEQKNQTISELESRIEELESQSSNTGSGDVTIDVTVNPANGQNFVEGGQAIVQAESENADVSEMRVEYGAGTYELDSSGKVAIPLANTGTQEMTLVYGDTTEQVSIDVQSRGQQNQQDEQNGQDSDGIGVNGPGFGIVGALIALLAGAFLRRRFR